MTEEELKEAQLKLRQEREKKCSEEINQAIDPILKKYNCRIGTNINILINGHPVTISIISNT